MAELVIIGKAQGQQIVTVHAFEASAAEEATFLNDSLADASAITLRDDWVTNLQTAWLAALSSDYVIQTVGSQIVERPSTVSHRLGRQDRAPSGSGAGANASAVGSLSAAAVIRWKSLIASRHARGRTFVPCLPSILIVDGIVQASAVALLNTYANTLRTRYAPTGAHSSWNLTVYSRPYDSPHGDYAKRTGGVLAVVHKPDYDGNSNFVTAHQVDNVARSQRRRELGVGA
jgi:hypothetical protein